ncbi:corticotropin-releasing factor receptor 1-like [Ascaphus truei]|uniref:corticotropin-releasing factor receptor 1-like n=1 Tax=Ascaphus truei TaxID=8439 RepID=UPI003F59AFB3
MLPARTPSLLLAQVIAAGVSLALSSVLDQCESLQPGPNISGLACNASIDMIGTCWPHTAAGRLVARPCPEYFQGVQYNTTGNVYRECLFNGSWAGRGDYAQCQEILRQEVQRLTRLQVLLAR